MNRSVTRVPVVANVRSTTVIIATPAIKSKYSSSGSFLLHDLICIYNVFYRRLFKVLVFYNYASVCACASEVYSSVFVCLSVCLSV